eukprot:1161225-Pelagomonas_calceolata.AAC.7
MLITKRRCVVTRSPDSVETRATGMPALVACAGQAASSGAAEQAASCCALACGPSARVHGQSRQQLCLPWLRVQGKLHLLEQQSKPLHAVLSPVAPLHGCMDKSAYLLPAPFLPASALESSAAYVF